ncbi:hypothetical protein [Kitasatospora sp. NPDC096204]|uniref:hypothetical protein n=1 Tax=Kitasatospora sp. NPDC096204 TaxID=3364094 RepID=UPI003830648B
MITTEYLPLACEELAELRWHLGLGHKPEVLRIVPEFPLGYIDDDGELVIEDRPQPLLGGHGEPWKIDGALVSILLRRERTRGGAWGLTSRQEIHPDQFDITGELLCWLAAKAGMGHRKLDGSILLGYTRFYEEHRLVPLVVRNGVVIWP